MHPQRQSEADVAAAICENTFQTRLFAQLAELISAAHSIVLCAHTGPDGDAIGSVLAMDDIIASHWAGKEVTCLLADSDPVPEVYRFLPGSSRYMHAADYLGDPDLFICIDLPGADRLNEAAEVCRRSAHVAIVDHHPAPVPAGEVCVSRTDAAAAGVIVAEFARYLGVDITPAMAQCLLCAIVTDTGRFQFQNTDGEAFKVASILVDHGADPSDISLHVYQSCRMEYLHLQAIVMGRISSTADGRIAYSWATADDLASTGTRADECDGLIDIVRSVAGSQVAMFLREVGDGKVRGNLRAKGGQDVSCVAREMGGGGHTASAGFTFEGTIEEACARALPLLVALLDEEG